MHETPCSSPTPKVPKRFRFSIFYGWALSGDDYRYIKDSRSVGFYAGGGHM